METGEDFSSVKSKIKSANIYFGATAVVEALKWIQTLLSPVALPIPESQWHQ